LLWWTKGFNVPDCLNQDVGRMLEEGLQRHGTIKVKVKAIMNDTVAQLASAVQVRSGLPDRSGGWLWMQCSLLGGCVQYQEVQRGE